MHCVLTFTCADELLASVMPALPGLDQPGAPAVLLRILLVDDDELVRSGTVEMLEDLGHAVLEAETGTHALQRLKACNDAIDVVITDHAMPGMSGLELLRRLRNSHPGLPVILASGYAHLDEDRVGDAQMCLSKPYRQDALAAALTEAVAKVEAG